MKILLVGSGGREHALAWKLSQSPLVTQLYIAPGNGGTAALGQNVDIRDDDLRGLVEFAQAHGVELVVPGPELPLTLGLADALADVGIACFGPRGYPARLEASKSFAKTMMLQTGVPTAPFAVFEDYQRAKAFVAEKGAPIVIKADGLAAGKGVVVCQSVDKALFALEQMMVHAQFGAAGERVVVEELLVGEEVSFLAFCDGTHFAVMPTCQDHKRVGDGDTGDNTGGMGAFSPARILGEEGYRSMAEKVIRPIVDNLRQQGHPFVGVLYAGLILTERGVQVLEYNVRFGDPECQPLMQRLDSDLAAILLACCQGRLQEVPVAWKPETSVCVVLASQGYPGDYVKGKGISGIDAAESDPQVKVFQAGTKLVDGRIVSSGGRVLGVTALGQNLTQARQRAYAATEKISMDQSFYRRDIGAKGLKWE